MRLRGLRLPMDEGISRIFNEQHHERPPGTEVIGKKIITYERVSSTNDLAGDLAKNREEEGTVVFARTQTDGRGRHGRRWVSPYGEGLYFSFFLRPSVPPHQASRFTLTFALAVAQAFNDLSVEGLAIQWPNDILVSGKKVCGILTQVSLEGKHIDYLLTGIGINVNTPGHLLPGGATSLKQATGRTFDLDDVLRKVIRSLDKYYKDLVGHGFGKILEEIRIFSSGLIGSRVRLALEGRNVEGVAVGLDADGGLLLRKDNGLSEAFLSGEVIKLSA